MPATTLLLLDPCGRTRSALAAFLRRLGHAVLEAEDGVQGLRTVREAPVGLVVAEIWPFFCGSLQMMELLRQGRDRAHPPVLVLTAALGGEYRARAEAAGCAGYLERPCAPEALLAEISRLAGAAPEPGSLAAPPPSPA